jgi:hypothetical protein
VSVHIGELHTDVVTTGEPAPVAAATEPARDPEGRAHWLAERVAAEGYED